MKKLFIITLTLLLTFSLAGCCVQHTWEEATCTAPKTCSKCGKTEGELLPHTFKEATCKDPKTCSVCGTTEGETLPHTWQEATCKAPKTCSVCKTKEGEALPHTPGDWEIGIGTDRRLCKVCGASVETRPTTIKEMNKALKNQPVYVSNATLYVQDNNYKALYPDLLMPTLVNNSDSEIQNVEVLFAAWDANGLPVQIKTQYDYDAYYVIIGNIEAANIIPGGTWAEGGIALNSHMSGISTVKAIVANYTDYAGNTWTNPWLSHWKSVYEGKKLDT